MDKINNDLVKTKQDSIVDIFKNEFTSTVIPVYIKSLDKILNFREITVKEQKSLTKTQIENQYRPATIYRAFNALIENTLINKNVDINSLTEADRYTILFNLYQTAFLDKPQEFKCEHCKFEFETSINSREINSNFNKLNIEDKVYTLQDNNRYYIFTCNYPTIKHLSSILDVFQRKNLSNKKELNPNEVALFSVMESIDYTNAFIKSIIVERIDKTSEPIKADFENMDSEDILSTLSFMPHHIMLDDEKGITAKILTDFINPINSVFAKQKCPSCNEEFENQIGSVTDFLA